MKMLNNLFRIVQHKMYGTVAAMLLMVATCSFFACSKDDETSSVVSPYAENRTVMVYMVAENSLSSNANTDIREMLEGMNNDTLPASDRLVIYLDDTSQPRIYVVDKNTKAATLSELQPVKQYTEDVNSASAEQLGAFVDYVKANYSAASYGLLLWSHASGWLPSNFSGDQHQDAASRRRSFGVDNQRNSASKYYEGHQMNIEDMASELNGENFDFILIDACVMQNIEVAYELRHTTKCLIASPAEIPEPGAHYKSMVRAMFKKNNTANEMLNAYLKEYLNSYGLVISALNTAELDDYAAYMKSVVAAHRSELLSLNTSSMLNYIQYGLWTTIYPDFLDMQGIMLKVLNADEYAQWKAKTDKLLTCRHAGFWYSGYPKRKVSIDAAQCCGITMHIPFEKYNANSRAFNEQYLKTSWAKAVWGE